MKAIDLAKPGDRLSILCLGAHSDDIEIGAGGTILKWIADGIALDVHWCVLSAAGPRREEAQRSAEAFLAGAKSQVMSSKPGWKGSKLAFGRTSYSRTVARTRTKIIGWCSN
jgi:hypothetical protein